MKKLIYLFLLVTSVGIAQPTKFQKIDSLLTYLNKNNKFMGSLCISEKGNVVFNKSYGYADAENNIMATNNTKYKIGSITKTFTSAIIFQLIEERKLRLETTLRKYFPKVAKADSISIEDLLFQRTGIPDYINHDSLSTTELNAPSLKDAIYKKIENYNLRFSPKTKYEYSNSNYYLLGGIIEKITGLSYQENVKQRITNKLNLQNTYYKTEATHTNQNESYSHLFSGENWENIPEWKNETAFAAGAIISTPEDLTLFMNGLFAGKLINKKSLETMKTIKDGYGAALIQMPFGDRRFYGHTGGIEGFRSVVGYNEKEELSVSLIVNGDNFNRNDIMIGVLSIYYKMPFPFPNFEKINPEIIAKYSGTYASKDIPLKISIFEKDGEMLAKATGQSSFMLTMKNENTFVFTPAGIEMVFNENTFVLKQGGIKFLFEKE